MMNKIKEELKREKRKKEKEKQGKAQNNKTELHTVAAAIELQKYFQIREL